METRQSGYKQLRLAELSALPEVYPHKFGPGTNINKFRRDYGMLENNQVLENITENIAGRIQYIRTAGSKLFFVALESNGQTLQVLANARYYGDPEIFKRDKKILKRGDVVGVTGHPTRSASGELSIMPINITMLAPCLYNIPKDFSGLADKHIRFGQRYLDFIVHPKNREIFLVRSRTNKYIRNFLDDLDFVEIETPILSAKAGGASARPFTTHHNDLDKIMYMRVAPELYLKQLVIGGFEKIYELGKQFRNESIDSTHNPEFTTVEIYQAYADYNDMMEMAERMLHGLVVLVNGSPKIKYDLVDGSDRADRIEIDFTPPFKRIDLLSELQQKANFVFPPEVLADLGGEASRRYLIGLCNERGINCGDPQTAPRLLDKLAGVYLEPTCIHPTFITNHPQIMSPLAKYHRNDSVVAERFELFIAGREFANAYTELNDPTAQQSCFEQQAKEGSLGDAETQPADHDFVRALEYGLPPTGGLGIGIDRLVMLLANQSSINEVISFSAN